MAASTVALLSRGTGVERGKIFLFVEPVLASLRPEQIDVYHLVLEEELAEEDVADVLAADFQRR